MPGGPHEGDYAPYPPMSRRRSRMLEGWQEDVKRNPRRRRGEGRFGSRRWREACLAAAAAGDAMGWRHRCHVGALPPGAGPTRTPRRPASGPPDAACRTEKAHSVPKRSDAEPAWGGPALALPSPWKGEGVAGRASSDSAHAVNPSTAARIPARFMFASPLPLWRPRPRLWRPRPRGRIYHTRARVCHNSIVRERQRERERSRSPIRPDDADRPLLNVHSSVTLPCDVSSATRRKYAWTRSRCCGGTAWSGTPWADPAPCRSVVTPPCRQPRRLTTGPHAPA
jgi:hypothetical protein